MKLLARFIFWISGWKLVDTTPGGIRSIQKCVLIGAPHTSNWDFVYTLAAFTLLDIKIRFLAKDSLFNFPLGMLMRASGGIPVDRSQRHHLVETMIDLFRQRDRLVLVIPVEGTRSYTKEWKSGFYHVAMGAQVPIVLGFLDYAKKEAGFHSVFTPTGDYAADVAYLQSIYRTFTPKYPALYNPHESELPGRS